MDMMLTIAHSDGPVRENSRDPGRRLGKPGSSERRGQVVSEAGAGRPSGGLGESDLTDTVRTDGNNADTPRDREVA